MAVAVKAASLGAGRSNDINFAAGYVSPVSYNYTRTKPDLAGSNNKLSVLTSTKSLGHVSRSGASSPTSPRSNKQKALRANLRNIDTDMSSYTTTTTIPASTTRSDSRIGKLHKRGGSGSSLPASPSPLSGTYSQYATPFATQEEPFPEIPSIQPSNSTPKIRPYLRKLSSAQENEDQGRLDLSKSTSESGALAGLGIQDFGARSASDVNFSHTGRRTPHTRTTSTGSQISTASGSFKPTQPFIHPMRQTPNVLSTPSVTSLNDDEARESSDIVIDDDVQVGQAFRNRSMSIPSTIHIQPTPLSQSHTAFDLGEVPKLTNQSQTNLSIQSEVSSRSRLGRPRRDTERSDFATSSSSRTSFDKVANIARRSDPDAYNRDERIREARRKFDEKEASKDRKMIQQALKRRETDEVKSAKKQDKQRTKSDASQTEQRSKLSKPHSRSADRKKNKSNLGKEGNELRSKSYDELRQPDISALPTHGREAGMSEKTPRRQEKKTKESHNGWQRFSTWLQTRMLSCGGKG